MITLYNIGVIIIMNKKEKSKMVGFRLPTELYTKAGEIAANRGDSLSNLIKKALSFIINNPKELADFESMKKDVRNDILADPVDFFKKIKKFGFSNKEELTWITELMQMAWHRYNNYPANAMWVAETVKIFEMVVDLINNKVIDEEKKEILLGYSISTFPEKMGDIKLSINKSLNHLNSRTIVSGTYADFIARSLSVAIRKIDFKIEPNELSAIYSKMKIWAFIVATRGLINYDEKIDTSSLSENNYQIRKHKNGVFPLIENGNINISILLAQFDDEGKYINGFSAAISFEKNKTVLPLIPRSLYELHQAIEVLEDEKPRIFKGDMDFGKCGEWTLYRWHKNNSYSIMRPGIAVNLSKEDFDNFIKSVKELYDDEDVQVDLLREYFEIYGAV